MAVEVALAMLQREGRWLMPRRDEIPTIVAPGCWGLFGGHLNPGEILVIYLTRTFDFMTTVRPGWRAGLPKPARPASILTSRSPP